MNFEIFMFYFISIYAKKVEIKSADKLKLYNKNNIVIIINFKFNLIYVRVAIVAFVQKINFNERGALTSQQQQQQQQFTVSRWFVKRGSKKKIKLFKLYHETLPSPPLPVE